MNLDDLLTTIHTDRLRVADEQVKDLERQMLRRRLDSIDFSATILSQIEELNRQIGQLQAEGGMADIRRRDREPLERERRELQRSLRMEALQAWRDVQGLKGEQRHIAKDAREEVQRYERLNGGYDA